MNNLMGCFAGFLKWVLSPCVKQCPSPRAQAVSVELSVTATETTLHSGFQESFSLFSIYSLPPFTKLLAGSIRSGGEMLLC